MSDTAFCRGCGKEIHKEAAACPNCGAPQQIAGKKSKTTAILLALFLGGFGAHKFYLGKTGMGVLYLLFFWTFIPSIAALVELIIYICTSDQDFKKKYG